MADKKRHKGYIWVTWLTKLLAKEDKCWYRGWYKTQHKYDKTPDDPERADFFAEWTKKHDRLVNGRAEELRLNKDLVVRLEDEGAFKLVGKKADLAGKPDIVALSDREALIIDGKAGKKRKSDHWQVLIYMFALPLSWLAGTKLRLRGEVLYKDESQEVRPLGDAERNAIVEAINVLASDKPPKAAPSTSECRFCDIASCQFRAEIPVAVEGDATRFF
jgi:hypothetical protein